MALSQHTREIGQYTYTVNTLNALKGRSAFVRLANAVGPVFKDVEVEADFVKNILTSLSEKDVEYFCKTFGETTTVTGGEYAERAPVLGDGVFGTHFAGNYLDMFEWLAFCLEVNFGSFFVGFGPALEKAKARIMPAPEKTKAA